MIGTLKDKLLTKLQSKKYRDAYVAAEVTTGIAYQLRALREQRHWTQEILGQRLGKGQNAVSRLEDPDYGRVSVKTLTELAAAFDVGLLVKFVPFTKFLTEIADKSPRGLAALSFGDELPIIKSLSAPQSASISPFPSRKPLIPDVRTETVDLKLDLPNVVNQ
ncbi:MAG: helix-turn-helix domain-containing protein [Acidiferrobacter sp.]